MTEPVPEYPDLPQASESTSDDYRSDFEAPPHTVCDVRRIGTKIITTVLMHGEIIEFEKTDPRFL